MYYFNSSNGLIASNPNTLRDQGAARNCEYRYDDGQEVPRNITWRELIARD